MQIDNGLMCWLAVFGFTGCTQVPGETLTSGALQREVKARVLSLAASAARECKRYTIIGTEVLELHPDGKVSTERWTVERCGERVHYRVNLPPSTGGSSFVVSPER
jgi:hypothetical protein